MYWNHRVFKETSPTGYVEYTIREVYYDTDSGAILGWTANGAYPQSDEDSGVEYLKEEVQWMLEACDKPVIEVDPEDNNKLLNAVQVPDGHFDDEIANARTYETIEELLEALEDDSESGD